MSDTMFVSGIQENGKNVEDNQPKRGMIGDCDCGCSTSVAQTEEDFALYRKAVERVIRNEVVTVPAVIPGASGPVGVRGCSGSFYL